MSQLVNANEIINMVWDIKVNGHLDMTELTVGYPSVFSIGFEVDVESWEVNVEEAKCQ